MNLLYTVLTGIGLSIFSYLLIDSYRVFIGVCMLLLVADLAKDFKKIVMGG